MLELTPCQKAVAGSLLCQLGQMIQVALTGVALGEQNVRNQFHQGFIGANRSQGAFFVFRNLWKYNSPRPG